MKPDCAKLVEAYVTWLRDRISYSDVNGACEITTPFLDRHNDRLQIYVQKTDQGFRLTDDGYTMADLEMSGCSLDTRTRKHILRTILNGFGVHVSDDDELVVESSEKYFPQKKHALVQAMLAVNDMFIIAQERVKSFFWDDVNRFLDQNNIRFTSTVAFVGKTGYTHKFDFVIPRTQTEPERILRAINNPDRDRAISLIFAWEDTREARPPGSQAWAVLNDTDKQVSQEVLSALSEYDIKALRWSARDQFVPQLVG